jgi:hypothetical protein
LRKIRKAGNGERSNAQFARSVRRDLEDGKAGKEEGAQMLCRMSFLLILESPAFLPNQLQWTRTGAVSLPYFLLS